MVTTTMLPKELKTDPSNREPPEKEEKESPAINTRTGTRDPSVPREFMTDSMPFVSGSVVYNNGNPRGSLPSDMP